VDEQPVTRHAQAPDGVSVAYQVSGEGPLDVLFMSALAYPIDLLWEDPSFVHFAKRLRGFSRTVWYEGRGLGASGGDFSDNLVEGTVDGDLTAVLDAVGCERMVVVGTNHAGSFAIAYAANYPERVTALVLLDTYAHYVRKDDYPWGLSRDALDRYTAAVQETWGTGATTDVLAPSKSGDDRFRAWFARAERLGIGPDIVAQSVGAGLRRDVRQLLPRLSVPTLVLHREGDRLIRVGAGRYLAEHIPGAKYVELPGDDHLFFVGDTDALVDEVEEFLTGRHQGAEGDVVTTTILFTDIVASTQQSARLGHRRWSALTDAHDAMVRASLQRHRGREIKTIGDGFLATFDATTRGVRAAMEIVAAAKGMALEVRAGVHTGEVEVRPMMWWDWR
jgi:pimeloyl-ACP methyl ester carboxylesterase